jgi:hypothetical protein
MLVFRRFVSTTGFKITCVECRLLPHFLPHPRAQLRRINREVFENDANPI